MKEKLSSRKLWVTVITGILITVGEALGFDAVAIQSLTATAAAYLVGQGIADHSKPPSES